MTERQNLAPHTLTDTHWTHHTHVIFAITAVRDDPVYSALLSLYMCMLHFGPQQAHMKEKVKEKKTYFHRAPLSLSLSSKFEEREKIKGEWSDGLWQGRLAPPRRWRTKSLEAPSSCKLHVLISLVTVIYAYFNQRCAFYPPLPALSLGGSVRLCYYYHMRSYANFVYTLSLFFMVRISS